MKNNMKWFFESMDKLKEQYEAVEKLSWYEWMLETKQTQQLKNEIKERTMEIIKLNFYKFNK